MRSATRSTQEPAHSRVTRRLGRKLSRIYVGRNYLLAYLLAYSPTHTVTYLRTYFHMLAHTHTYLLIYLLNRVLTCLLTYYVILHRAALESNHWPEPALDNRSTYVCDWGCLFSCGAHHGGHVARRQLECHKFIWQGGHAPCDGGLKGNLTTSRHASHRDVSRGDFLRAGICF